jgi:hypothetical protein
MLPSTMMADGGCDSSTGERSEGEERVKDGIECDASASSVMRNSGNGHGRMVSTENQNGSTPGMLTKAIIEKQEHIGLARQTGHAQTCAEGRYALGEMGIRNLRVRGL